MDLALDDLHSLLYGFDQFFGVRPASVHPHDTPLFRVHVVPYILGVNIRNADPDEAYFHVEFNPPDRAEIWHTNAWRDSLTRRLRIAGQVVTYYQSPSESVRSDLERRLIQHFKSLHLAFRHARALTEMLISGPENPHVHSLAILPPEIVHDLKQYRENLTQDSPPSDGRSESTVP